MNRRLVVFQILTKKLQWNLKSLFKPTGYHQPDTRAFISYQ